MIFLWEVLRRVFFNPFILLVLGVWLLLTMTPGGDWMLTEEERLGLEHFGQLERALSKFDDQGISTEVGAAQAYAHGCDMELNRETFAALMTQFQLDPDAFADGGTYRRSWLIGVERVATLLADRKSVV